MKVWLSTQYIYVDNSGATAPDSHRLLLPGRLSHIGRIEARRQRMSEATLLTTLMFLCAAPTPSSRRGGFPGPDDSVDERGLRDSAAYRLPSRFEGNVVRSSWRAAAETAEAIDRVASVDAVLAEIDHGRWAGSSFEEIEAAEPGALSAWLADPTQGAPDGETMDDARQRIGVWLDKIAGASMSLCAISHPMIIRAALAHTLGFPLETTLAIDIAPLSRTLLSFNRKWRLQGLEVN